MPRRLLEHLAFPPLPSYFRLLAAESRSLTAMCTPSLCCACRRAVSKTMMPPKAPAARRSLAPGRIWCVGRGKSADRGDVGAAGVRRGRAGTALCSHCCCCGVCGYLVPPEPCRLPGCQQCPQGTHSPGCWAGHRLCCPLVGEAGRGQDLAREAAAQGMGRRKEKGKTWEDEEEVPMNVWDDGSPGRLPSSPHSPRQLGPLGCSWGALHGTSPVLDPGLSPAPSSVPQQLSVPVPIPRHTQSTNTRSSTVPKLTPLLCPRRALVSQHLLAFFSQGVHGHL